MSITLAQTSTVGSPLDVGCTSRLLAGDAKARVVTVNGTAGSESLAWTHAATATIYIYLELITDANALDFCTWSAGTWTTSWNVNLANMNLTLGEVYICRLNSSGTSQAIIGSATALGISLGSTGVKTVNVTGTAQTFSAGDRVAIYAIISNGTTMTQTLGLALNQVIETPIVPGSIVQTDYRWRNDDGSESAATWAANQNTSLTAAVGTKRIRCRIANAGGAGITAFGWQYGVDTNPVSGFSMQTNIPEFTFLAHTEYSPDGSIVYLANTGTVRTYLTSSSLAYEDYYWTWDITATGLSASPDGNYIAIIGGGSPYWRVKQTASPWTTITGASPVLSGASGVAFSSDSSYLAIVYTGSSPYLTILNTSNWSTVSGTPTLPGLGNEVAYNHDSSLLAAAHTVGGGSVNLTVYNTNNWSTATTKTTAAYGDVLDFSPDGAYLAVVCNASPYLYVYNTSDWSAVTINYTNGQAYSAKFSSDSKYLFVGYATGLAALSTVTWDIEGALYSGTTMRGLSVRSDDKQLVVADSTLGTSVTTFLHVDRMAPLPAQGTENVPIRFAASTNVANQGATTQQVSGVLTLWPRASASPGVLATGMSRISAPFTGWSEVSSVWVQAFSNGTNSGNMTVDIASTYDGTAIATTAGVAFSQLPLYDANAVMREFTFSSPVALTPGNSYWVRVNGAYTDSNNRALVVLTTSGSSAVAYTYAPSANQWYSGEEPPACIMVGKGPFVAGEIYETAHTDTMTLTAKSTTELEAVVEILPEVPSGLVTAFVRTPSLIEYSIQNTIYAQSFKTASDTTQIAGIGVWLKKASGVNFNIRMELLATRDGTPMATLDRNYATFPNDVAQWEFFEFSSPVSVTASTTYYFKISSLNPAASNDYSLGWYAGGGYVDGSASGWRADLTQWSEYSGDLIFKVYEAVTSTDEVSLRIVREY